MTTKKRHMPLFIDDDEPTSTLIVETPTAKIIQLDVHVDEQPKTNILGFGPRFGKPWTRLEDLCMLQLLAKGNSIDQIASKMCRSAVSIGCRIRSEFNCKYKTMNGNDTITTLGFSETDIQTRIAAFDDTTVRNLADLIRKQIENPVPIRPEEIKHKPEANKQRKPIDELLSLIKEINNKLDLLIERTA
jgi:hypothetical protein